MQLVVADYIQSELQLKAGRENGELHELDGECKPYYVSLFCMTADFFSI